MKGNELGTWLRRFARVSALAVVAVGGAGAGSAGCLDRPIEPTAPRTTSTVVERLTQSSVDKIDLLLAIDNSRSMADKQKLLSEAVPDLVKGLVIPLCVDENGAEASMTPQDPQAPCPTGTDREFKPILDIHIGIISSSLGGHGSDACPDMSTGQCASGTNISNNDKGHLLSRKDPCAPDKVATYQNKDFLAWDPTGMKQNPPGESNLDTLVTSLTDMVTGVGQVGCGYEAQLESIYRFLADPQPFETIQIQNKLATPNGTDTVLLQERADFMRPNSLLAVIMLTDENDCSIIDGGQFYFAAQQKNGDQSEFHLPKPRSACATDPNDPCCRSCGQGPGDGCAEPDPACTPGALAKLDDNINARCFDQKRRFGIDFLYPVERYVNMFTRVAINPKSPTLDGSPTVPNPIYTDLNPKDTINGVRDTGLVFFAGIVGVPWQDIAAPPGDLSKGFKTSEELATPDMNGATTWDYILGDPATGKPPGDAHMIESFDPRPGTMNAPFKDYSIPDHDDLQYACIFPLNATRDCTDPAEIAKGCDCSKPMNDNPLCTGANNTTQSQAKGYPGIRQLRVLKAIGPQGITASVCPKQTTDMTSSDYGYRPAIGAIIDRLKTALGGQCLPRTLRPASDGTIPCLILEARRVDGGCGPTGTSDAGCKPEPYGRKKVADEHLPAIEAAKADPLFEGAQWNCFCEVEQLKGDGKTKCEQDEVDPKDPQHYSGWCYIDATTSPRIGNPKLVNDCPETEKRIVRFIGDGEAQTGATMFITCSGE
jgi:hypothetical protein